MIGRNHALLGTHTQLIGDEFDGINRRAVDIGLACLAQPAVTDWDVKPFEQALQCGGAAIHGRGLHHLGREPAPRTVPVHGAHRFCPSPAERDCRDTSWPAARSTSTAGDTRSMLTSTVPDKPCCMTGAPVGFGSGASSTRRALSRISPATRTTFAA